MEKINKWLLANGGDSEQLISSVNLELAYIGCHGVSVVKLVIAL